MDNQLSMEVFRSMMKIYTIRYIVIETAHTMHHIERLSLNCKDRGRWKWLAETKEGAFNGDMNGEDKRSFIDHSDLFPRLYFRDESLINEFFEWIKMRDLKITNVKAPKI